MEEKEDKLKKKISNCGFFIVLSTKNYLDSLKKSDKDIMTQIGIARELKKPFLIVEDARMSQTEREEARRYFSKDNVIDSMTVNLGDNNSVGIVARKIRDISRMFCAEANSINVVMLEEDQDNIKDSNERF